MNWRTVPTGFLTFLVILSLAAPFAAAQDEWFGAALLFVMFVLPVLIRLPLCWWIYNDAHRRGKSSAIWIVLAVVSPLIGAILWLMERDKPSMVYAGYYYPPPYYYAPYTAGYDSQPSTSPGGFRPTVSCRYCGTQIPLGSLICPTCGARQR